MNLFFVFDGKVLVTPPLGTILAGVTRDSVLHLAREKHLEVREQAYAFDAWRSDAESGALGEVFACGTAAVIAAVGEVRHPAGAFKIAGGQEGPVTAGLRDQLVGIQRGDASDPHGWRHPVAGA